jgi:biopolymer transport protein ExbD
MAKRRRAEEPVEMNMVPIMNLFLAMIPFLLSCAAFFQAAMINASVPALSEGSDEPAPDEEPKKELKKITLNLQVTKDGFTLSAQGDQPEDELKAIAKTIPKKDGEYDYETLATTCKELHDKYNKSDTVVILPDKDVLYDTLVQTMDASRERVKDPVLDVREGLFSIAVVSSIL